MVSTRNGKTTRRASDVQKEQQAAAEIDMDDFDFESDDDAPMEVSSKKPSALGPDMMLVEAPEPEMSLFEQVQARKKEDAEKKLKKEKARARRLKRQMIQPGEFVVSEKKAEFKVVTLDRGVRNALEPARNFKADLLKARTADRRMKTPNAAAHRAKWVNKK